MDQEITKTISLQTLNKTEIQLPTDYGLDALAAILHEAAVEKGFWDGSRDYSSFNTKLGYIAGEVKEILEAIKNDKDSEEIVACLVMILIRTLDLYAAMRNEGFVVDSVDDLLIRQIENNKTIISALHRNLD